jgi:excisionase family DNA binding protein
MEVEDSAANNPERFNRRTASQYLGISLVTLDRALAKRKISHFRVGRRVVFARQHLDDFLKASEVKARNA